MLLHDPLFTSWAPQFMRASARKWDSDPAHPKYAMFGAPEAATLHVGERLHAILAFMAAPVQPEAKFMRMAIELATENVRSGKGGPFGAVVVRNGEVLSATANTVTSTNDPTAHAEVNAIRAACTKLGTFQLEGCDVYTSCEPCPMCLAALYWSRCRAIFYGNSAQDAAAAGFDDSFLYEEVSRPISERHIPMSQVLGDEAISSFDAWTMSTERIDY